MTTLAGPMAGHGLMLGIELDATAQDAGARDKAKLEKAYPKQPDYSRCAGRDHPRRPLFGDTHLHTGFSMDAGAFGARLTPRSATSTTPA